MLVSKVVRSFSLAESSTLGFRKLAYITILVIMTWARVVVNKWFILVTHTGGSCTLSKGFNFIVVTWSRLLNLLFICEVIRSRTRAHVYLFW